jgi:hypothetical protein
MATLDNLILSIQVNQSVGELTLKLATGPAIKKRTNVFQIQ